MRTRTNILVKVIKGAKIVGLIVRLVVHPVAFNDVPVKMTEKVEDMAEVIA